ncbi:unnamed protein product, partial [Effrenium voratum]
VPAPNDPLPKLPPASLRRARLRFRSERVGGSALAALSPECLQGSVDVAASTLSLTFNILGMTLPNGKLVADILQGNNVVVESIVDTVHEKQEATDNLSIAQKVWQVFQILHDEGIFSVLPTHVCLASCLAASRPCASASCFVFSCRRSGAGATGSQTSQTASIRGAFTFRVGDCAGAFESRAIYPPGWIWVCVFSGYPFVG